MDIGSEHNYAHQLSNINIKEHSVGCHDHRWPIFFCRVQAVAEPGKSDEEVWADAITRQVS